MGVLIFFCGFVVNLPFPQFSLCTHKEASLNRGTVAIPLMRKCLPFTPFKWWFVTQLFLLMLFLLEVCACVYIEDLTVN